MDFFSEKELVAQTGHAREEWPLVILKELIDNALDACEEDDVAPVLSVTADASGITVRDNGPGIPEETLQGVLDFTVRTSSREAYVSPCRGAQGNALKTLLAMPWVLDPEHGRLIVTAHGKCHSIRCGADPISQRAVIHDDVTDAPKSTFRRPDANGEACFQGGTTFRLEWSARTEDDSWPFDDWQSVGEVALPFHAMAEGFALFNPHLTLRLDWFGDVTEWKATDPGWKKWRPYQPTSPHWYEPRHLERLIGAYVTHDRDNGREGRLVSDFLAEFDGLTRSGKRKLVLADADLKRAHLADLVTAEGRLDSGRIAVLLEAMKRHTKPVTSDRLGLIGEAHLRERLLRMGVKPESFSYHHRQEKVQTAKPKAGGEASFPEMPWVLESAFGWLGDDAPDERKIFTGANWSAAIKNPFRSFGSTGQGLETMLARQRATAEEPVVYVLHLAHPRVEFADRGKSSLLVDA
jgi:hypothetical protein